MELLMWLGLVALAVSLILTPVFRNLFTFCGFVDRPDHERKHHGRPIPRAGGLAIAVSYASAFVIVQLLTHKLGPNLILFWKVLPAAAVMFGVGVVDDLWGLTPWQKLLGQVIACGVACSSGILVLDLIGVHQRAWWTIPVTIFWLLASSNAFNLVDGMDGLAGGAGLFATITIFMAALLGHNVALAMVTIPLAGCLLGFLRYNFAPATVFLGDSGSLLIGFILGCCSVIWAQKSATLLGMMAPVMALSIPLLDVTLAIARRFLGRRPIFSADRGHIHHRLLDRGMSPRRAVLVLYGVCSVVAVFSLLFTQSHSDHLGSVIIIIFCAVAWLGIQYLGYAEFTFASRILFRGDIPRAVRMQLDLHAFDRSLGAASTPEACVRLIEAAAVRFGFHVTRLQFAGETFVEPFGHFAPRWGARISLDYGDYIELVRSGDDVASSASGGPFLDALQAALTEKLPALRASSKAVVAESHGSRGVAIPARV